MSYALQQTAIVWYQCYRQCGRPVMKYLFQQAAMIWYQCCGQCERLWYEVRFADGYGLVSVL